MFERETRRCIARFVFDGKCIRADGTVRHVAFLEKRPPHNTSVNAHDVLREDIHWEQGPKVNPARRLLGAADLETDAARGAGLDVLSTPTEDNPFHAELRGWPEDKARRIDMARDLADASSFVPAPEGLASLP